MLPKWQVAKFTCLRETSQRHPNMTKFGEKAQFCVNVGINSSDGMKKN